MSDLFDDREFPLHEQIAEVQREISLREFVYPNQVRRMKMTERSRTAPSADEGVKQTLIEVQKKERLQSP